MSLLNKSQQIKIALHIIIWCAVIVSVVYDELLRHNSSPRISDLVIYLFSFIIFALVSYLNILYFIPRFFLNRNYFTYIGLLISSILVSSLLLFFMKQIVWNNIFSGSALLQREKGDNTDYFLHMTISCVTMVFFTSIVHIIGEWMRTNELALKYKEAEKEKITAELKALKAQLNPHFLFNTLNNLYSLSLEKSDKTPDLIV